jgi:hypothetical protein
MASGWRLMTAKTSSSLNLTTTPKLLKGFF